MKEEQNESDDGEPKDAETDNNEESPSDQAIPLKRKRVKIIEAKF
jgi:hypothetical protein